MTMGKSFEKKKKQTEKNPEPLTKKQQLNNHIVLMRKTVKQTKVHLINKLAKEIKKLKERKGEEKAQEKAKRKADRLLQEVQFIKHLKEDRVSIFALQDKTKLEETLQKPDSAAEDRALSRLGHHQLIQTQVCKYREENPHWELQIPVLLEKSKEKRRQINKKLIEREAAKAVKNNSKSKNKALVQGDDLDSGDKSDSDSAKEEKEQSDSEEESDQEAEDILVNSEVSEDEAEDTPIIQKVTKQKEVPKPQKLVQSKVPHQLKPEKKDLKPKVIPKEQKIEKTQGTIRVQVLKNLEDLEENSNTDEQDNNIKVQVQDLSKVSKKLPKSSFFVGGEDEEPEPALEESFHRRPRANNNDNNFNQRSQNPSEFKPIFRKGKLVNKDPSKRFQKPDRSQQKSSRYFNSGDNNSSSNLIPLGNKPSNNKAGRAPIINQNKIQSAAPSDEKLHPSWEAKKRQQLNLSSFQGKKIKFNDDDN